MNLSPDIIYEMLAQDLKQKASEEGARDCISCGSCSYVCPAGIDLTSAIAGFAGEGRVIEVNSLLHNNTEFNVPAGCSSVGEVSLLENYGDGDDSSGAEDPGRLNLPFEGGKTV